MLYTNKTFEDANMLACLKQCIPDTNSYWVQWYWLDVILKIIVMI